MEQFGDLHEMKRFLTKSLKIVVSLIKQIDSYNEKLDKLDWHVKFAKSFNKTYKPDYLVQYFQLLNSLQEFIPQYYSMLQQLNSLKSDSSTRNKADKKLKTQLTEALDIIGRKINDSLSKCCVPKKDSITKLLNQICTDIKCIDVCTIIDKKYRSCCAYYMYGVDVKGYNYPVISLLVYTVDNKKYYSLHKNLVFPFVNYMDLRSYSLANIKASLLEEGLLDTKLNNCTCKITKSGLSIKGLDKTVASKIPTPFKKYFRVQVFKDGIKLSLKEDIILSEQSADILSRAIGIPQHIILDWVNKE